jgi:hypothetical protein
VRRFDHPYGHYTAIEEFEVPTHRLHAATILKCNAKRSFNSIKSRSSRIRKVVSFKIPNPPSSRKYIIYYWAGVVVLASNRQALHDESVEEIR